MDDYRSRSFGDERWQQKGDHGSPVAAPGMQHTRFHSTSHTNSNQPNKKDLRRTKATSGSSSKSGKWSLSDPEVQRKKRIATYNVYSVEGKMKGSFRKGFRWIKDKCSHVLYGWW